MSDTKEPLTIIELTAENVKRLKAVRIKPDGSLVEITGRNGQGKTSVLDAIEMALGGKDSIPLRPIRNGEKAARVELDLGDMKVVRTFTDNGGGTLSVLSKDGARYPQPQTLLDKLGGKPGFDPLAFVRMKPEDQAKMLAQLAGVDLNDFKRQHDGLYSDRRDVNRDADALQKQLDAIPPVAADTPDEEIDPSSVLQKQQKAIAQNAGNEKVRQELTSRQADLVDINKRIADLQRSLAEGQQLQQKVVDCITDLEQQVQTLEDIDTSTFARQLTEANKTNEQVRTKWLTAEKQTALEARRRDAQELTEAIDRIKAERDQKIATAQLPVAGLALGETGITINGVPFSQASSAEQIRTSMAVALALNPRLRIVLIREASFLDKESRAIVAEMAEAAGCQCWMERVTDGEAVGIVIEDGEVVGAKADVAEPAMA